MTEPIDAVYTWVDGSALWHRLQRAWFLRDKKKLPQDSNVQRRYANHDELRFSLRSLELYAPWIRTVYLVTDGSRPCWLRTDTPRLKIISHRSLFPHTSHLPTYNSRAIELHLARIPNLSERFLYLNDDIFFGKPQNASHFFSDDGRVRILFSEHDLPTGVPTSQDESFVCGLKNANTLLEMRFGQAQRKQVEHSAHPMLRTIFAEAAADFPHAFETTSACRFRSTTDISFVACLHAHYAWNTNRAFQEPTSFRAVCIRDDSAENTAALHNLEQEQPSMFCINDDTAMPQAQTWKHMQSMLQRLYPTASSFER